MAKQRIVTVKPGDILVLEDNATDFQLTTPGNVNRKAIHLQTTRGKLILRGDSPIIESISVDNNVCYKV